MLTTHDQHKSTNATGHKKQAEENDRKRRKQYRGPELLVIVLGVEVHAEVRLRRLDKLGAGHLLHQRDGGGHVVVLLALPQLLYLEEPLGPRLHTLKKNQHSVTKSRKQHEPHTEGLGGYSMVRMRTYAVALER